MKKERGRQGERAEGREGMIVRRRDERRYCV